jgi:Toprim domain
MLNLQTLRSALGGEIVGRQLLCPGPGHSPRDRSLSITISLNAREGFLVHSFAGDDFQTSRDYVRSRLGLPEWQPGDERDRRVPADKMRDFDVSFLARQLSEPREFTAEERQRIARAVEIWNQGVDPRGTLAETYLNRERALNLSPELTGNVLRFHPHVPWRDENIGMTIGVPAMIAAFTSIDADEIVAMHRVALTPEGKKIDRRMLAPTRRSAVKLSRATDQLAIGEGIETCMAAIELGVSPAWALGSVGAIAKFPLIDGIKELTLVGEAGSASANAVEICRQRWVAAGRTVKVIMPDQPFNDLNDELIAVKQGRAA